jgi:hypothetical protein
MLPILLLLLLLLLLFEDGIPMIWYENLGIGVYTQP